MRIKSSAVATSSSTVSVFEQQTYERLRVWDKNSSVTMFNENSSKNASLSEKQSNKPGTILSEKDILELSQAAKDGKLSEKAEAEEEDSPDRLNFILHKNENYADRIKEATQSLMAKKAKDISASSYVMDNKIAIMQMIIEKFSGRKVTVNNPFGDMYSSNNSSQLNFTAQYNLTAELATDQSSNIPGWGLDYEYMQRSYSKEGINYEAKGNVTTEDNRMINFQANLELLQENVEESHISVKQGAALIDPLVLNLDGEKEILSDDKFLFDLDNDGVEEEISTLQRGKAFLAIDKNNNGIIDNGSELFGPATDNGFAELRAYDSDNNNWIDENDEIFSQLRLWQHTSDGSSLTDLLSSGVGAIYLGSNETAYDLLSDPAQSENSEAELTGRLKETSFFLKEDGSAGLVHEVDFTADKPATGSSNTSEPDDSQAATA